MNLSGLLYSVRVEELIRRFRRTFDTILIDTAPVLSVPDARMLARTADGVVLVVRAHSTQQESAYAAIRCFEEDGRRILGTILNDWDPRQSTQGVYGQYASYGTAYHNPNEERLQRP
jgi:Mrp family chromosome partitioning ATPase